MYVVVLVVAMVYAVVLKVAIVGQRNSTDISYIIYVLHVTCMYVLMYIYMSYIVVKTRKFNKDKLLNVVDVQLRSS